MIHHNHDSLFDDIQDFDIASRGTSWFGWISISRMITGRALSVPIIVRLSALFANLHYMIYIGIHAAQAYVFTYFIF